MSSKKNNSGFLDALFNYLFKMIIKIIFYGILGIFLILFSFRWLSIPNKSKGIETQENQEALQMVERFIIDTGQPYYYRGVVDKYFNESIAIVISGLQQHPVWGWIKPADGIISTRYLEYLEKKAIAYNENKNIKQSLLDFISAVNTLQMNHQINVVDMFEAGSLAFANGILVGWADDLAVEFLYGDDESRKENVAEAFRQAILVSELYFPITNMICLIIGTIFSIGGLVAIWLTRSADSIGHAFMLGFGAEIGEAVLFHGGYYYTTGRLIITRQEVYITIAVAFFMGFVGISVYKKYHRNKQIKGGR